VARTALKYFAVLVGSYILVSHYTGAGTLIAKTASGASSFTKTLQGR
jgi:hypothetical protein